MGMKRGCLTAISVIALVIVAAIVAVVLFERVPAWRSDRYFQALLQGKDTDAIVSVEFDDVGKHVMLKDRESIVSWAGIFAKLERGISKKEWSRRCYRCRVTFAGGQCDAEVTPYADLSGMEVTYVWADPLWGDDRGYHVDFSEEPPVAVKRVLEELVE
jgi:hypothetical protein